MSATPTTPTTAEPNQAEIGRFVDLVDALWKFEAIQRSVRGHGAFPPDTPMPDPSFVRVMAWLKELSCMSDHPTKQTTAAEAVCEACGEPATRQDCEGVWLCDGDYQHMVEHWLLEEAANCDARC